MTTENQPKVGKAAPAFSILADNGEKISLKDFKGDKNVVLYFYPKDNTPGCTQEACDFRDDIAKLKRQGVEVLGVSPDSVKSHTKFKEKFGLPFSLLADEDRNVCEKYGVWVEKSMYGRKYMGVQRATFLIGKDGKIAAAWPKVKVKGHVDEVMDAVKQL